MIKSSSVALICPSRIRVPYSVDAKISHLRLLKIRIHHNFVLCFLATSQKQTYVIIVHITHY